MDNRAGSKHPHTREFSMFFQAALSVLGVVALIMMNVMIDNQKDSNRKMDEYAKELNQLAVTFASFMATTNTKIEQLNTNQQKLDAIQRERTGTVKRAEKYFDNCDRGTCK